MSADRYFAEEQPLPFIIKELKFSDGPDVDRSVWTSPQWAPTNNPAFIQRTAIRSIPDYGAAVGRRQRLRDRPGHHHAGRFLPARHLRHRVVGGRHSLVRQRHRRADRDRHRQHPQTDMSLVFNFWVPSTWGWADNANLQPTDAANNQQWIYEVAWAKVYVQHKS